MPQTTPYAGKFSPNPYRDTSTHYVPVETVYGGLCYHDNSLVSGSLEALIQHLVPTVDYFPDVSVQGLPILIHLPVLVLIGPHNLFDLSFDVCLSLLFCFPFRQRSYIFTFLLSSRLFLHPYEVMARVCYMCLEQHRTTDPQIDRVLNIHKHTLRYTLGCKGT